MVLENINVQSLKNAINSCKNSINYSQTSELCGSVLDSNIWINDCKYKLNNSLDKLKSIYSSLEDKLDNYTEAANMIERYQTLNNQNNNLQREINDLNNRLYYDKEYTWTRENDDGTIETGTYTQREKDYGVEQEINSKNSSINSNNMEMSSIKANLYNFL